MYMCMFTLSIEYLNICEAMLTAWSSIYPTHKLVNVEIIAAMVQYYKPNKTEMHASSNINTLHTTLCHCIEASLQDRPLYAPGVCSNDKSIMSPIRLSHGIYLTQLLLFQYTPTISVSVAVTATAYDMGKATESLNIDLLWRLLQSRYVRYILY